MKVLVVDDETVARGLVADVLRLEGFGVLMASDGEEALEAAQREVPDVVLLDVMLPGMDGFEVCRRLRAIPELREVSIYIVTALADRASRLMGFEAGADDFLTKPVDRLELRLRMKTQDRLSRFRGLLEQRSHLEELALLTPDGLMALDRMGSVLEMNPKANELFGATAGDRLWDLFDGADSGSVLRAWRRLCVGPDARVRMESLVPRPDGEAIPVELTFRRLPGEPRNVFAMLLVQDLSERVRMRTRLDHAERLALIARTSSGVGHDLVTYLVSIQRALDGIADSLPAGTPQNQVYKDVTDAILEAAELVHRMNELGPERATGYAPVDFDLNERIRAVWTLLRHVAGRANLRLDLADQRLVVHADPIDMTRVLANLISNAAAATGESGTVGVTSFMRPGRSGANARGAAAATWCFVQVSDDGPGIPRELVRSLFEPFFTTKAVDGGLGLGLANVKDIVTRYGGTIQVETQPGRGTTFTLGFPASTQISERDTTGGVS